MKGPLLEARKEIFKANHSLTLIERKADSAVESCSEKASTLATQRYEEVSRKLRDQAASDKLTVVAYVEKVFGDNLLLSEAAFIACVEKSGLTIPNEQIGLLFDSFERPDGLDRRKMIAFIQQHWVVLKTIALTDEFEISKCKTLRKVEAEEILETLEGPETDAGPGLVRVKARSLADGVQGWVTIQGNQGQPFLQEIEKPVYFCANDTAMKKEFTDSEVVRILKTDEAFELMEGPKKETFNDAQRAKVKVSSDGLVGWLTLKDGNGHSNAGTTTNVYEITSSVAMTDELDVRASNVIRKCLPGEAFVSDEEPKSDDNILRLKGIAQKDNQEGWITLKGNAGTEFAKKSSKHFQVLADMPLHETFSSVGAKLARELKKGEVFQVIEGPKAEKFAPVVRIRGKTLGDGMEGWVTLHEGLQPWSPNYVVLKAQPLHSSKELDSEYMVREIEEEEAVTALEGPLRVGNDDDPVLRIRVRATNDHAEGWLSIRSPEGECLLQCQ
jgi:hypothetical protein